MNHSLNVLVLETLSAHAIKIFFSHPMVGMIASKCIGDALTDSKVGPRAAVGSIGIQLMEVTTLLLASGQNKTQALCTKMFEK